MKLKSITLILFLTLTTLQYSYGQIKGNWKYKRELISYMQSPKDTIFIQDRKNLEKVDGLYCNNYIIKFNYKCKNGDSLNIKIENTIFIKSKHTINVLDSVYKFINNEKRVVLIARNLIDGKPAFGIDGYCPKIEIKSLKIKWDNNWLDIPESAFQNLYETHLCIDYMPVEAYITNDNKFLYLYISASDGAGSYAVKFIFDRTKYRTRIVNRNECSNHYNFIDATEGCE